MRFFIRGMATLVAMCLAALAGGNAFASPKEATESLLRGAGVASPVGQALKVSAGTIDVDGLAVRIQGAGSSTVVRGRHTWADDGVQHVAQRTTGGAQLLSVLKASGPRKVTYDFPGRELQLMPDGSVSIVDPEGKGELVAYIEKPWAKDANGHSVATHYEVSGSSLTQVVVPTRATQFPVVADPYVVGKWYGKQIRYSRTETKAVKYAGGACAIGALFIPDPTVTKIISAACGALALAADFALDQGNCLAVNVYFVGGVAQPWYWNC